MHLRDEFLATHGGDRIAAAVNMALGLMRSDPRSFKLGYTRPNAVLAVVDVFDLTDSERQEVNDRLLTDDERSEIETRLNARSKQGGER
jgi:hypothetical protein